MSSHAQEVAPPPTTFALIVEISKLLHNLEHYKHLMSTSIFPVCLKRVRRLQMTLTSLSPKRRVLSFLVHTVNRIQICTDKSVLKSTDRRISFGSSPELTKHSQHEWGAKESRPECYRWRVRSEWKHKQVVGGSCDGVDREWVAGVGRIWWE